MQRRAGCIGSDQAASHASTGGSQPGAGSATKMASSLAAFLAEAGARLLANAPDKEKWVDELVTILEKEKARGSLYACCSAQRCRAGHVAGESGMAEG